ncbi:MAG TPA: alkyl sulfatase dimerization domain-containing protein [Acidimicrobiales bacterium]|nr:alkyl sulfatase dimerization domain-containing protein [Acidimicrobiales bacterium]
MTAVDDTWWTPRTDVPLHEWRPSAFSMQPASMKAARQVHDRIWVSAGLTHSYLVSTDDGRVIVGTGMGFEAPVHKRNFDAVDPSPTRAIIFTQGHPDHVGGADHLREEGTELIAQSGNAEHLAQDARLADYRRDRSNFAFATTVREGAIRILEEFGELPEQACPTPTVTFGDRYEMTIGGVDFELIATPGGETFESLVVWLPQFKVLLCGNLFSALTGHIPNLVTLRGDRYRQPLMFVDSVERVRALRAETLLPGHHGPIAGADYIDQELRRVRDATLWVHDRTVEGMNSGMNLWDLMSSVELPPELRVGEGYGKVSWNVRAIWEQYAGWFKHESTTELYGSPRESVDAELVELAGGAAPVAARARTAADDGDHVRAIHLAEAALRASPEHSEAQAVMLDSHRALLADSDNFWLSSWLRHQIQELES